MVDHKIDYDIDPHGVCRPDKVSHVIERSELGIDVVVVLDIVFVIAGAYGDRHEPDSVEAHVLYVGKLLCHPVEVSDSVVVRIEVGPYVYFVVVADFVIQGLGL